MLASGLESSVLTSYQASPLLLKSMKHKFGKFSVLEALGSVFVVATSGVVRYYVLPGSIFSPHGSLLRTCQNVHVRIHRLREALMGSVC